MAYILKNNIKPKGLITKNIKAKNQLVKYVKKGKNTIFYDIQSALIYDKPVIYFEYPNVKISATGGLLTPIKLSFAQTWKRVGYSGNTYELTEITSGASITYEVLYNTDITNKDITVNSDGVVKWESRSTNSGEERYADIKMTVEINGLKNSSIARVYLLKNEVEHRFSIPEGVTMTVADIPAYGGVIEEALEINTDNLVQYQTNLYSTKELEGPFIIKPEISEGYYSEFVYANDLKDSIINRRKVGTLTYYYTCNGVLGQCQVDVFLEANSIKNILILDNTFYYDDIEAKEYSILPKSEHLVEFEYNSNYISSDIPTLGTTNIEEYYDISRCSDDLKEFIKSFDTKTGKLEVYSRGVEFDNDYRIFEPIIKYIKYTYEPPNSAYGEKIESTDNIITSECRQEPNLIKGINIKLTDAGNITLGNELFPAYEDTKIIKSINSASCICNTEFSSGAISTDSKYLEIDILYSWNADEDYAIIYRELGETCEVSMLSRETEYDDNTRKAKITRTADITINTISGDWYSIDTSTSCITEITQSKNLFSKIIMTVDPGLLEYPDYYPAKRHEQLIEGTEAIISEVELEFDSGDKTYDLNTYGSIGEITYSWRTDKPEYVFIEDINTKSNHATMLSRGVDYLNFYRDAVIYRNVNIIFILKDDYKSSLGNNWVSGSDFCDITITQEPNIIESINLNINPGELITPNDYSAFRTTKEIKSKTLATALVELIFSSEETEQDYLTYGELQGPIYSWECYEGYVGIPTDDNKASISITMESRYTEEDENTRKAEVERWAYFKYVLSSDYGNYSEDNNEKTTVTITLLPNYKDAYRTVNYGTPNVWLDGVLQASGNTIDIIIPEFTNEVDYWYSSMEWCRTTYEQGSARVIIASQYFNTLDNASSGLSISRFSINGNRLKHTSMEDNAGYDYVFIKAYNIDDVEKYSICDGKVRNVENDYSEFIYGFPTVNIDNLFTASGGKAYLSYSVYNYMLYYYTSGYEGKLNVIKGSGYAEIISNGNNRFDLSGTTITHGNMTTLAVKDTVKIRVYNDLDNSYFTDAEASITNYKNDYYDSPIITNYYYDVFPYTGGSKLPNISYELQSYYSSGYKCEKYISGGSLNFIMDYAEGFTLKNVSTGEISTTANNSSKERYAYPKVSVTMHGKTSDYFTCTQCKLEAVLEVYKINDTTLHFTAAGGTKKPNVTYSKYNANGTLISTGTLSKYTLRKKSSKYDWFVIEGLYITVDPNYSSLNLDVGVFYIESDGYLSGELTCTIDVDSIERSYIEISADNFTTEETACSESGGSCTITAIVVHEWVSGEKSYDVPTEIGTSDGNLSVTDINTSYKATATFGNTQNTVLYSAYVRAWYNNIYADVYLYQMGKTMPTISKEELIVTFSYSKEEFKYSGGTAKPSLKVEYKIIYDDNSSEVNEIFDYNCTYTIPVLWITKNLNDDIITINANLTGNSREAQITANISYTSPNTNKLLTGSKSVTIILEYQELTLKLVNPKTYSRKILLSINGYKPNYKDKLFSHTISPPSTNIDISKGLEVLTGPASTTILKEENGVYVTVYELVHSTLFKEIGLFMFSSGINITFGI